jgi:hypothetical protein
VIDTVIGGGPLGVAVAGIIGELAGGFAPAIGAVAGGIIAEFVAGMVATAGVFAGV